jgi:rhamnulose-1-phosphate aldolase/alcohol dehydrogenase
MRSRWDERTASKLSSLDLLVYASRLIGAETSLVVWGGGNTSIKTVEHDHRDREIGVLRVKGSGSDLKSVLRKDFPGVRMDDIRMLLERQDMDDQEMVAYLTHALIDPAGLRPSVETLLHGFVDAAAVIHTHADAIVSLTNNDRPREVLASIYDKDVIALQYRRPGFRISREVAAAVLEHREARALVLEHHGTICWGATIREAYEATIELVTRAEEAIAKRRQGRQMFGGPRVPVLDAAQRRAAALALAPRLRGRLGRARPVIVTFDDAPDVREFASSVEAPALSQVGPATPDHTLYTKRLPCFVELERAIDDPAQLWLMIDRAVERFAVDYAAYFSAHNTSGAELTDALPRVVLVPGLGMFTVGRDRRMAGIVDDIYHHTIDVIGNASVFGRYESLSAQDAFDLEYWALELYKLTLAPRERELSGRIALVAGGAAGIGRAVSRRLASEGAHVVIGDLDEIGAQKTADEIVAEVGGGRAIGILMDVTSEASVRAAFEQAILTYGGVDIVVSNLAVAHSALPDCMTLVGGHRSVVVDAIGQLLVAREAVRVLIAQGLGGALVFITTENRMSPGKTSVADGPTYGQAEFARILAREGTPHRIRSNIVSADLPFVDSRIWSQDVRHERVETQGTGRFAEGVSEAVLFLVSDRSSRTTGCTLTVHGEYPDIDSRTAT